MLRRQQDKLFLAGLAAIDVLVTCCCWVATYLLRWSTGIIPPNHETPRFEWCLQMLPVIALASLLSYQFVGMYSLNRLRLSREIWLTFRGVSLMVLLAVLITFYFRHPYESRLATIMFLFMAWGTLVATRRLLAWWMLRGRPGGPFRERALIVGSGRLAQSVYHSLNAHPWLGIEPVGYVDNTNAVGVATMGTISQLPELIEQHQSDYVFLALPMERYAETPAIFDLVSNTLAETRLVPDVPSTLAITMDLNHLDGLPVLSLRPNRHGILQDVLKRTMDVTLSALALIMLSPVFVILAIIIKWKDGGPVFYLQERMGLNGQKFMMIKFRSMRVDAEQKSGPIWATETDERRTAFGSFLRRTSLDELPQLFNVLIGEMSLVGPRPERPYFIHQFRRSIPLYMRRHAMKAGITGWAQVHGWRGNTSLRKRVQYDLYYIANWSIWLDIRILVLTVFRVLNDRNAY